VGAAKSWLWNVNKTEEEAKKILKDPGHPAFLLYAARRLAHANLPKEIFRDYLNREDFLKHWPAIKRQMNKDSRNHDRALFWGGVYEYLKRDLKAKGISFPRPKAEARVDPEQQKAGQAIKGLRRSRKMTQAELAREAGLTQQHIAKIEKGLTRPRPKTLKKIERTLGVSRYEYKLNERPSPSAVVTEPVTTWFSENPDKRTESK
jgi:DNA-binding XRE family transcriptional regulator